MGGFPVNLNDVGDFVSMIQQANLSDMGYMGSTPGLTIDLEDMPLRRGWIELLEVMIG